MMAALNTPAGSAAVHSALAGVNGFMGLDNLARRVESALDGAIQASDNASHVTAATTNPAAAAAVPPVTGTDHGVTQAAGSTAADALVAALVDTLGRAPTTRRSGF